MKLHALPSWVAGIIAFLTLLWVWALPWPKEWRQRDGWAILRFAIVTMGLAFVLSVAVVLLLIVAIAIPD